MNLQQSIPVTEDEYRQGLSTMREILSAVPEAHAAMLAIAGDEATLEAFASPRPVGIGRFAALTGLNATTVRHYIREGVLTPFEVGGRFRFILPTLIQLRSVQQWQELGLSLSEIRTFMAAEGVLGLVLPGGPPSEGTGSEHAGGMITMTRTIYADRPADGEALAQQARAHLPALHQHALERAREARAVLEARHAELGRRLDSARAMEAAMEATIRKGHSEQR